jgi:hypothetical protein
MRSGRIIPIPNDTKPMQVGQVSWKEPSEIPGQSPAIRAQVWLADYQCTRIEHQD